MKNPGKRNLAAGLAFAAAFAVFTWLVQTVDVKPLGVNGTDIGFAALNLLIHRACGVHMALYAITDWAGLVPVCVVLAFGILGFVQLLKRGSLAKVDGDILILGIHYLAVAGIYLLFEKIPVNYRPILIGGAMESSYPSSTTLLVLGVMPTLTEQLDRRCGSGRVKTAVKGFSVGFSLLVVAGRLFSGVHWATDILGGVLIGAGLNFGYKGLVLLWSRNREEEN